MQEYQERQLQSVKEQIERRIEDLRSIVADKDSKVIHIKLMNKAAVIIDWAMRLPELMDSKKFLFIKHNLNYAIIRNAWFDVIYMLIELKELVQATTLVDVDYGDPVTLDEMGSSEEIESYIYNLAWRRMMKTPDKEFDEETQERYGVSAWRNGRFYDLNGEEDDTLLSVWDLLKLSEQ